MAYIDKPNRKIRKRSPGYDYGKEVRQAYYTQWWRDAVKSMMQQANYLCQDCLDKDILTEATEVHHIKPVPYNNPNWRDYFYDYKNLICLCHECHQRRHHGEFYERKDKLKKYLV